MTGELSVPSVDELAEVGFFTPLERHLARRLTTLAGEREELVLLAAALAGRGPLHGQVCVSLHEPPPLEVAEDDEQQELGWRWPEPQPWLDALSESALVGDGHTHTPLVLDAGGRLYLYRYFQYQQRLIAALGRRANVLEEDVDLQRLREGVRRLFGEAPERGTRGQRLAAIMAICRRFSVISGGPGTGKTTTVLKILALLQENARAADAQGARRFPLRVVLLAPTGKAAARLSESIKLGKAKLEVDEEILDAIPDDAATIHRALGYRHNRPTQFVHGESNPLSADVVMVDESSMVDLALMTKLLEAVPPGARLLLLGDRDQLASVEAGAILGDICNVGGGIQGWSSEFVAVVASVLGEAPKEQEVIDDAPDIADCIHHLSHSFRFGDDSGIGALSRAINAGEAERALSYLQREALAPPYGDIYEDLDFVPLTEQEGVELRPEVVLGTRLEDGYRGYLEVLDRPAEALRRFDQFRVICAHRRGRFGVEALNALVRQRLARGGLVSHRGQWYAGRPILITRNDYQIGLFNGDIGLTLVDDSGQPRVHFLAADGRSTRSFHPARLPAHETAFALTVHKSQGSEFDEVLLLLPRTVSPIVSRELIYTGVTRARKTVTLVGAPSVIKEAVTRRVQRASGLRPALWARPLDRGKGR